MIATGSRAEAAEDEEAEAEDEVWVSLKSEGDIDSVGLIFLRLTSLYVFGREFILAWNV